MEGAQYRLLKILIEFNRIKVLNVNPQSIHAEAVSAILHFVDDLEFFFDEKQKRIHIKSASRKGYSDLGVNRRRIEKIRQRFNERK